MNEYLTSRTGERRGWRAQLTAVPQRVWLTYKHRGARQLAYRTLTFPLRFTPLEPLLRLNPTSPDRTAYARRWYRRHGRPVTVVIPSYRDAEMVAQLVRRIRRTTPRRRVRIVVADDASGPEHLAALGKIPGIRIVPAARNGGFAANVNRGLRAAHPDHDVVLLNSDTVPRRGWLAALQYASQIEPGIGIVGAKLLYPDGRIQYAGTVRNLGAPEWFDHRYRFKPADFGPAQVAGPTVAATGACMYITRAALNAVGEFDERYPMAFEDVDYCLRAWEAGYEVRYAPTAQLVHMESVTRGTEQGERELASQRAFWSRWSTTLDQRNVRTSDGGLRVVYVTEGTGVGGGHRVIFEHLNGLADKGHDVSLWTLGERPTWFELRCPVRSFASYEALGAELAPVEAIKVATWWATSETVWRASVVRGIPVYFVQDIETSYYSASAAMRSRVLASYRQEFHYMTTSSWNIERLRELGLDGVVISPGLDLDRFRPLDGGHRGDMVLALGRSEPLKNLPLTIAAWRALAEPRPELCLFGVEPELAPAEAGVRYVTAPSDSEVNELFNRATAFVQTSTHEGFCLPVLESMATGGAVVCTDAHGNRDFCVDGENCLVVAPEPGAVAAALSRVLADSDLRARLGDAGMRTAQRYGWPVRIDALERFLEDVAQPRPIVSLQEERPAA
jgi:GT2 family glycosyltransferase/glycosyltransferase involved in cell wall biosynthesis